MAFIQIIEGHTAKIDELRQLEAEWRAGTEGKRTLTRGIVTTDRNDPGHFFILAFFDSYESAMENSALPETGAFAEKQIALLDGPATFYDLDVIEDQN
jgi:hypothetical protein